MIRVDPGQGSVGVGLGLGLHTGNAYGIWWWILCNTMNLRRTRQVDTAVRRATLIWIWQRKTKQRRTGGYVVSEYLKYARVRLNQIFCACVRKYALRHRNRAWGLGLRLGTWMPTNQSSSLKPWKTRESRRVTQFSFNWRLRSRALSCTDRVTNPNPGRAKINYDDHPTNCRMKYGFLWHWAHFAFEVKPHRWSGELFGMGWGWGWYGTRLKTLPILRWARWPSLLFNSADMGLR